jgi:thioredoxin reductase (NADPH)
MTELDKDEQFYRDTESIAFPKLDDRQLAMLEPLGARRIVRCGELVYKAGQRNLGLTAVLRGELEVFESRDGQEQILATAGPRGFIGDVAMLMGTAALANARGKADESEILEVPADRLRQALAELPGVSEPIVRVLVQNFLSVCFYLARGFADFKRPGPRTKFPERWLLFRLVV